ncbi:MAG: hypothetical protein SGI72_08425 [Planctomycetota bacterium]|nr:hypothetical protein [Planctomycetota bacterium]
MHPARRERGRRFEGQVSAGNVRHYQVWYRDADLSFCSVSTFNLTNGSSVTWTP